MCTGVATGWCATLVNICTGRIMSQGAMHHELWSTGALGVTRHERVPIAVRSNPDEDASGNWCQQGTNSCEQEHDMCPWPAICELAPGCATRHVPTNAPPALACILQTHARRPAPIPGMPSPPFWQAPQFHHQGSIACSQDPSATGAFAVRRGSSPCAA
jgi:hypothetical protein